MFFKGSSKEHEVIQEEYCAPNMNKHQMLDLIHTATKDDYSFLFINTFMPFETRYRKNLDQIIEY
jgi:hypothetical protein